jgi:hypothetical protein
LLPSERPKRQECSFLPLSRFNHDLRFAAGNKPFPVQAFVAQLAVEAFHKPVPPRATGFDIGRSNILITQPLHHCHGGKFRAIVEPNENRLAIQAHQS